jgi:hypothetical protein
MKLIEKLPENRKEDFLMFIRFLKERCVYTAYFRNLKNNKSNFDAFNFLYEHNLTRYFSDGEPFIWLTECFCWAKQKEGRNFWERLHNEWQKKLDKQRQKLYGND